jgi:hypothetical protein
VEEFTLPGGIVNAGLVTRVGSHVLRPSNVYTRSIHNFLADLRATGFDGASVPVGVDEDGRARLEYIDGDVPLHPYPDWARSDAALASIGILIRRYHDAARTVDASGASWNHLLADSESGPVVCHNDVCLENVVFRGGIAVGLIDFEWAAPGRPTFDLAQFARMCVPLDDDASAAARGWRRAERRRGPERLRLVCDVYRLDASGREELLDIIPETFVRLEQFIRWHAGDGDPAGLESRNRWWAKHRDRFAAALLSA